METSPLKCNVYLINASSKITQNYKHSEDKGHILSGSFSLVRGDHCGLVCVCPDELAASGLFPLEDQMPQAFCNWVFMEGGLD